MTALHQQVLVPQHYTGQRFDQIASQLFPDFSRSRLQVWIKSGDLSANGRTLKPNAKLAGGETLVLATTLDSREQWQPEAIPLDIVAEDKTLMIINKPVGLVVHPAAGNWQGTLMNGLLFARPHLQHIPRAGIVHRLDKNTSGLMAVALSLPAQLSLVEQLQQRSVSRTYWAIVHGQPDASGRIDAAIGRHTTHRTKMAVQPVKGKQAITHFQCLDSNGDFSLLKLKLETGRTHQIRVHLAHLGFPIVGDDVYGYKSSTHLPGVSDFPRQALHAKSLGLQHPDHGDFCQWHTELPEDMRLLIEQLDLKAADE